MKHLQRAAITALAALALPPLALAQDTTTNGWGGRAMATFSVGAQTSSPAFNYEFATTLFNQNATAGLKTPGKTAATFDVGAGVRLVQNLGVGVTYARYSNQRTATLTATIPNPLYPYLTGGPSTASKELPLQREETAVHIQAIYRIPLGSRVQIGAFGGPSYFRCMDDHVTKFALDGTFTDLGAWKVSFYDVQQLVSRDSVWGYHGGASVTVLATRHVGVGFTVRYSNASHTTMNHLSDTTQLDNAGVWGGDAGPLSVTMKHGGVQWNGGLSFHF